MWLVRRQLFRLVLDGFIPPLITRWKVFCVSSASPSGAFDAGEPSRTVTVKERAQCRRPLVRSGTRGSAESLPAVAANPACAKLLPAERDDPGRWGAVVGRRVGCMMAATLSVLVEVDEVAAGVVEDRVGAAVLPPEGLLDEHHPLALSRSASRRQSSLRSDSTGRPSSRLACWNARAGSSVRCSTSSTPSGSSGDTTVSQRSSGQHLGVEPLGLVLVVDEDAGQPDPHRPGLSWSLGQLAVPGGGASPAHRDRGWRQPTANAPWGGASDSGWAESSPVPLAGVAVHTTHDEQLPLLVPSRRSLRVVNRRAFNLGEPLFSRL